MSWGTDFTAELYLNRLVFTSQYDLEDKIDEVNKNIENLKQQILMFASSNPKDITPPEWEDDAIGCIHSKVNDLLNQLDEDTELLVNLIHYKESNPKFGKDVRQIDAYCTEYCVNSENCDHVNCSLH